MNGPIRIPDKRPLGDSQERRNSRMVPYIKNGEPTHIQERRVFDFLSGNRAIKDLANTKEDRMALARSAKIVVRKMLEEYEMEKQEHTRMYGKAIPFNEMSMSDSLRRRIALIAVDSKGRSYRDIHFLQEEANGEDTVVIKPLYVHQVSWLDELEQSITPRHLQIAIGVAGTVLVLVAGLGIYTYSREGASDDTPVADTVEKTQNAVNTLVIESDSKTQATPVSTGPADEKK